MNKEARVLRTALLKLNQKGTVPLSQLSKHQQQALNQFAKQTNTINLQKQGRGDVYCIVLPEVFDVHFKHHCPDIDAASASLPSRALNIALTRGSKTGKHQHSIYHLLLKASGSDIVWSNQDTQTTLPLCQLTQAFGSTSLTITNDDAWSSNSPLWLVENQALFDCIDWMPKDTRATVLYYQGHIDGRLLTWLSHRSRSPEIVLFADYDGVGLSNFARLYAQLGESCQFWLMPDWQQKLLRYGNRTVWQDTFHYLNHIETQIPAYLWPLVSEMRSHGLALEQEAVWLSIDD